MSTRLHLTPTDIVLTLLSAACEMALLIWAFRRWFAV